MVPALNGKHSREDDLYGGQWPERRVGRVLLIGLVAIAAAFTLFAVTSARFGIGPQLPAVAYLLLAFSSIMLLGNFMITLIRDEIRAGFYLVAFWAATLIVLFAVLGLAG